uniref:CAZy families GH31 protein n=1 Tax=uncultured Thermoanaerobacterium sp. TaxID=218933 RepID=A0A060BW46_9THEO|nr:CAZy families GH31 protein [uncultured Thermoanaerobacterium sp.]
MDTPLLTIEISTPLEGVLRVRLTNHRGGVERGPHFQVFADPHATGELAITDDALRFRSGSLTAHVARHGEWRIDFTGDGCP